MTSNWRHRLNAAVAYHAANGTWPSQTDKDPEVRSLGLWVAKQRVQGKKVAAGKPSQLGQERYDLLDAVPGWVWGRQAAAWENGYTEACNYYAAHGKWPFAEDKDLEVKKLGNWVNNQRKWGKKLAAGETSQMTRERYDRLDATPGWEWGQTAADWADAWENSYIAAVNYYTAHGKWPSQKDKDPEVQKLGQWANSQRVQGKKFAAGKASRLDQERYDRLDTTPGWVWGQKAADLADAWGNSYRAAVAYHAAYGKWPSVEDKDLEVKKLGNWVNNQRTRGRKRAAGETSQMARERYDRLDATPGWVWGQTAADAWENSYIAAVAYRAANGKWPSPKDKDPEVKKLGDWVNKQRFQGKQLAVGETSQMTQGRYDRLDATTGWVWSRNHPTVPVWETNPAS